MHLRVHRRSGERSWVSVRFIPTCVGNALPGTDCSETRTMGPHVLPTKIVNINGPPAPTPLGSVKYNPRLALAEERTRASRSGGIASEPFCAPYGGCEPTPAFPWLPCPEQGSVDPGSVSRAPRMHFPPDAPNGLCSAYRAAQLVVRPATLLQAAPRATTHPGDVC